MFLFSVPAFSSHEFTQLPVQDSEVLSSGMAVGSCPWPHKSIARNFKNVYINTSNRMCTLILPIECVH
jgi:hypothetical protein